MKTLYVDSSILVAILLQDLHYLKYLTVLDVHDELVSSQLIEAEVLSVAKRELLPMDAATAVLEAIQLAFVPESLANQLKTLFSLGYCRGADAYHLATALYLDPKARNLVFFTADKQQAKMASLLGFSVKGL